MCIYIYIRPASRSMDVQCFHLPKDETDGTQEKDLPMAVWCEGNPLSMSEVHSTIHWYKRVTIVPFPSLTMAQSKGRFESTICPGDLIQKYKQNFIKTFLTGLVTQNKWLQHGDSRGPWVKVWLRSKPSSTLIWQSTQLCQFVTRGEHSYPWFTINWNTWKDQIKRFQTIPNTSKRIPESSERKSYTPLKSHEFWRLWARYLLDVSKKCKIIS